MIETWYSVTEKRYSIVEKRYSVVEWWYSVVEEWYGVVEKWCSVVEEGCSVTEMCLGMRGEGKAGGDQSLWLMVSMIFLKLSSPASMFSMISLARISGSGRLSRSDKLLSLSQKISRLVLSRAMISS